MASYIQRESENIRAKRVLLRFAKYGTAWDASAPDPELESACDILDQNNDGAAGAFYLQEIEKHGNCESDC